MVKIGISGNVLFETEEHFKGYPRSFVSEDYVKAIADAKGIPLIIPIVDAEYAKHYIAMVDGLLLSGGQDITPSLYNEQAHQHLKQTFQKRDIFEMALIKEAIVQNKPIFGICRGLQLLNIYFGGSLYQDLPSQLNSECIHDQVKDPTYRSHTIVINPSFLSNLFGKEVLVNSFHHQAIKQLGENLACVAMSNDGVIEAIEHRNLPIFGVQFHPEMMREDIDMQKLFRFFVEKCKK